MKRFKEFKPWESKKQPVFLDIPEEEEDSKEPEDWCDEYFTPFKINTTLRNFAFNGFIPYDIKIIASGIMPLTSKYFLKLNPDISSFDLKRHTDVLFVATKRKGTAMFGGNYHEPDTILFNVVRDPISPKDSEPYNSNYPMVYEGNLRGHDKEIWWNTTCKANYPYMFGSKIGGAIATLAARDARRNIAKGNIIDILGEEVDLPLNESKFRRSWD